MEKNRIVRRHFDGITGDFDGLIQPTLPIRNGTETNVFERMHGIELGHLALRYCLIAPLRK